MEVASKFVLNNLNSVLGVFKTITLSFLLLPIIGCSQKQTQKKPNVIIIMTDDQGFANLECLGYKALKTPNINTLASEAVSFTNFHQEMLCAPSRASLLTGRYSSRTGAWRTNVGRSIMKTEEQTIAEIYKENGYKTGLFGKWHLGDNYPYRPQDQGFDEVVSHRSGGVGQLPDYWGNDYFDDVYYHNGKPKKYEGYCADVWFNEAMRFIKANKENPFCVYLASNTPHSPYNIADKYVKPFRDQGISEKSSKFLGMISNLDENMGRFLQFLKEEGLDENTILVFTTDDGPSGGAFQTHDGSVDGFPFDGYNAGLRGRKASPYEGGHKTFCYIKWPNGDLQPGKEIDELTAGMDLLPTLLDLSGLDAPKNVELDGLSLVPLLRDKQIPGIKDRYLCIQLHGSRGHTNLKGAPHKYIESAVIKGPWRLINGSELYNLDNDLEQRNNIATQHPSVVQELKSDYETWFQDTTKGMNEPVRLILGSDNANPVELNSHDCYTVSTSTPSMSKHVDLLSQLIGPWKVNVEQSGRYHIKVSRYPIYSQLPIGFKQNTNLKDLDLASVKLTLGSNIVEKKASGDEIFVTFDVELEKGPMDLSGIFVDQQGEEYPTYFMLVEKI